jgi:hypothetical protein
MCECQRGYGGSILGGGCQVLTANAENNVKPTVMNTRSNIVSALGVFTLQKILPQVKEDRDRVMKCLDLWSSLEEKVAACVDEHDSQHTAQEYTEHDVMDAMKQLHGYVISPLDKNVGVLSVVCEKRWHSLYEQTFLDQALYELVVGTEEDILLTMRNVFEMKKLGDIAGWNLKGVLPLAYILFKDKEGGTLMLKAAIHLKHFGITSVKDLWVALWDPVLNPNDYVIVSFDVKQMFTSLKRGRIEEGVLGFIDMVQGCFRTRFFHVLKEDDKHAYPGKSPCNRFAWEATFLDVWHALESEMEFTIFKVGNELKRMIDGLGIGGTMSPFGACAMCMYYEHKWQSSVWRDIKGPIRGARMVDGLPMIIHVQDFSLIQRMQRDCYPEGVVLEIDGAPSSSTRCLECEITIQPKGGVTVVARNKNELSLKETGTMRYKRYPHWTSYCPERIKTACIQGTIHRYVANTLPNAYQMLWKPIWLFILELRVCGYPWRYIWRVFKIVDLNWLPIHPWGYKAFVRMWNLMLRTIKECKDEGDEEPNQ